MKLVACKVHYINPNWPKSIKENYFRHALREAQTHQKLNHKNIVKYISQFEIDENSFCTVQECCTGPDLGQYLRENQPLDEEESKKIMGNLIQALHFLQSQPDKIIHYDLKPQNILFDKGIPKITDFGLCKILEQSSLTLEQITLTSQGVGTYWYLPPECFIEGIKAQITAKVDIWSLGIIFYEMLFGERPFGQNMSQERILQEKVILNCKEVKFPTHINVSKDSMMIIKGCLEYSVSQRWDINKLMKNFYEK